MVVGIFYCDNQFFRFYEDGTFLDCLIEGIEGTVDGKQIHQWFRREKILSGVLQGTYLLNGKKISFSTPGHFGDGRLIDYRGEYKKDRLLLDSLNHNTGQRIKDQVFLRC